MLGSASAAVLCDSVVASGETDLLGLCACVEVRRVDRQRSEGRHLASSQSRVREAFGDGMKTAAHESEGKTEMFGGLT